MYKLFIKPILFLFKPEVAHHLTFAMMKFFFNLPGAGKIIKNANDFHDPSLSKNLFGITFPNPVGLAAGLDKNAELIDEFSSLGFGFIEIGTVTPKPQPGNPQPRLFRLPADKALINRMGFNNDGVDVIANRLRKRKSKTIIGGNIGKNKVTSNEDAIHDYEMCFETLFEHVDYFVVNVSSPNTPNLRALQEKEPLKALLARLQSRNEMKKSRKPILLKIAPDLNEDQLMDIIEIVEETSIDGVIATNTTISRDGLRTNNNRLRNIGAGGLSGKPLKHRSTEVIKFLKTHSKKKFPVIGVGGIHTVYDAIEKLKAGADLIQIYTGFIYEGPVILKKINKAILKNHSPH